MQARLAVGMTALALGVTALVAVGGFLVASRFGPTPEPRIETRLEQVGDSVALVRIESDLAGPAATDDARRNTVLWVLAVLGVAFVPAASLAWVVAGRLLRPVQRLTDVVDRVEGPESPERTGLDRGDELGALAAGLDDMLDRLEGQRREQERLLHEVIHELRTPLAVAGTNLELAGTAAFDEDGAARIAAARRAIERMGRTVDDLAAHGRLSLGAGDGAVVDLAAEGRALVAEHHGPAAVQGIHLAASGPDALPVSADRSAIRTATSNLVSNALRVGPRGSTVTVAWGERGSWAWLAVRDEGPGLAPEDHPRVFERYWRGRYERDREEAGDESRADPARPGSHHRPPGRRGPRRPAHGQLDRGRRRHLRALAAHLARRRGQRGRGPRRHPPVRRSPRRCPCGGPGRSARRSAGRSPFRHGR